MTAPVLLRGRDASPGPLSGIGGYMTPMWWHRVRDSSLSVSIELNQGLDSRVLNVKGAPFPSRYIHDAWLSLTPEVDARAVVTGYDVDASLYLEYCDRTGTDTIGLDTPPEDGDAGWAFSTLSLIKNGTGTINFAEGTGWEETVSAPISPRTLYDAEGTRDFVRLWLQLTNGSASGWDGSFRITGSLWINQFQRSAHPRLDGNPYNNIRLDMGLFASDRKGDEII